MKTIDVPGWRHFVGDDAALDSSKAGKYRKDFHPEIKPSAFINLYTGEWIR